MNGVHEGASPREGGAASSPEEEVTCEKQRMGELAAESRGNTHRIVPVFPGESEEGRGGAGGLKRDSEIVPVENGELTWETEAHQATLRSTSPWRP